VSRSTRRRAGIGAIVFGTGYFTGRGGARLRLPVDARRRRLRPARRAIGLGGLLVAVWHLRPIAADTSTRVGIWLLIAAAAILTAFGAYVLIEVARTSEVPEQFVPFAIALLLLLLGQPLLALALRRSGVVGRAWPVPLVGVLAIVLSLTPIHDVGLFVLEGAWVALGVALLREGVRPD
jgi:hypothetical protein